MTVRTDRRGFMLSTVSGAIAVGGTLQTTPCRAIEPITRTPGYSFKLSMAAYSYRELLLTSPPPLTLIDFIDDCAKFGLTGTELTSYYFPETPTEEYLRQLKAESFRRGLAISGTAVRNDFCLPPGKRRDAEIAHVKRWIEYADMMGAPVIRIFSGDAKPGQSAKKARLLAVAGIETCCEHAGTHGVFLALENHGGITSEVDEMLEVVRAVDSPWFGVNMDTGNFQSTDIYGDLAKLAPYSINVQVKAVIRPAGQAAQPSNFPRLAEILRKSGYRGYVVLEFEEAGDPRKECQRYVDAMREAFV